MATSTMNRNRQFWGFVGWLALCFAAAAFGGLFPPGEWYAELERPVFTPPDWLFGPVWTLLYLLMGVAAWRVWRIAGWDGARLALSVFLLQLLLNALWSVLFFGLQSPGLALLEILFLWVAIVATIGLFARIDWGAAVLLLPYLLWVSFAAILNAGFWWLN